MIRKLLAILFCVTAGNLWAQVPEWVLFDNPSERRDNRWVGAFEERVIPLDDAKMDSKPNHYHMNLKGLYELPPPNATGRCVRFHIHDGNPQKFRLLFETDGGEYRIELGGGNYGFLNGLRMDGEQPVLLADDGGRRANGRFPVGRLRQRGAAPRRVARVFRSHAAGPSPPAARPSGPDAVVAVDWHVLRGRRLSRLRDGSPHLTRDIS